MRVRACLAEGLGIRATARGFAVAPNPGRHGLVEAAAQLRACSAYFLCAVHHPQGQLDEVYAVLREVHSGALNEDEASTRLERSPAWGWTALAPDRQWLLVIAVGTRTLEMAQRVGPQLGPVVAPDGVPLFVTDGCRESMTAFLTPFGCGIHPERGQDKGPMPQPRWMPVPQFRYAQVGKS